MILGEKRVGEREVTLQFYRYEKGCSLRSCRTTFCYGKGRLRGRRGRGGGWKSERFYNLLKFWSMEKSVGPIKACTVILMA